MCSAQWNEVASLCPGMTFKARQPYTVYGLFNTILGYRAFLIALLCLDDGPTNEKKRERKENSEEMFVFMTCTCT